MARRPTKLPALPEHVVARPEDLAPCLDQLERAPLIGFDTEFVGEDAYRPELCLVQISTDSALYIIDPFACGPLDRFWDILTDPAKTIVVHAGREDIRICNFAVGRSPNVFDVQLAAGLVGYTYPIGYAGLVQDLLGNRMSKGETLTDWRRRPLQPAQVRYAFDDVRFLLPAWKELTDRLSKLDRLAWAGEEFEGFVKKAAADDATLERWRKVKGTGGFDRKALAIVREIFTWRDSFAQRVNRPPRMLLRDDLIAEIARRAPKTLEDLQMLRGLPRGEPEAILEAVRRARNLGPSELPELEPRDNDPTHVLLLASLLGVVLSDLCSRKRLASNLVATGQDLKAVVRSKAGNTELPDIALTRGWRSRHILPELLAVLEGRHALRVVKPNSSAPLSYQAAAEEAAPVDDDLDDEDEE
jgi:ribonuclease D